MSWCSNGGNKRNRIWHKGSLEDEDNALTFIYCRIPWLRVFGIARELCSPASVLRRSCGILWQISATCFAHRVCRRRLLRTWMTPCCTRRSSSAPSSVRRWATTAEKLSTDSLPWRRVVWYVMSLVVITMWIKTSSCLKKTVQICFCQNFVKFPAVFIIFDRKMAKRLKLCEVHSFSTSHNSRHHTTILNVGYMWNKMPKLFYFTCNHVWNYFKIILAAERALKLFQNNFGDIQHVGKYLWAAISFWNYLEIISDVVTFEIKHWNNREIFQNYFAYNDGINDIHVM